METINVTHKRAEPVRNGTFADLLADLDRLYDNPSTRRDYGYAIKKCPEIYSCNSLAGIMIDLDDFEKRFPLHGFNPSMPFHSEGAYQAWRKKVLAALKVYLGLAQSRKKLLAVSDDWTTLVEASIAEIQKRGISPQRIIPLKILAMECRDIDTQPLDLNIEHLSRISARLKAGRLKSFRQAIPLISKLCAESEAIKGMVPNAVLFESFKNIAAVQLPTHLTGEVAEWVNEHCRGDYDVINDETGNARSGNTHLVYMASFKAYLGSAMSLDLLDDVESLKDALKPSIFRAVLRIWFQPQSSVRSISNQTANQYVRTLKMFAENNEVNTQDIKNLMKSTRQLKDGKKISLSMSRKARAFCAWLLSNRNAQIAFLSMHISFYNRSKALIEVSKYRRLTDREQDELRQTGTLAAMISIWLWFAPLRIDNMVNITIFGKRSWLFMPDTQRDRALLLLPQEVTKNKKSIRKKLGRDKSRSLEILEWYIREIRSRHPDAETSPYLFPGYGAGGKPVTSGSVRVWLKKYCRSIAFYPLSPHWFRHGVASIFLQSNPGAYTHVSRLLDDAPATVRDYYGFIDDERLVDEAQQEWLKIAGLEEETPSIRQKRGRWA